ncbi:hypothetical protein B0A54_16418 [Friedmanniomyces endolithicus]|uniref:Zn(2)-C6 fungal-type domain-containing protein n=1 Tax=Friedmanniomyces endolithicus TaxID=329885 RepID=A0A4U0TZM4_9PEZI|nr:hypothetical protein LTS09_015922 [Friedmanniomyces endolithicus]TKA28043.1 hypothetical protein B0A54_16418 [Friedmanniomyces endolithicus]
MAGAAATTTTAGKVPETPREGDGDTPDAGAGVEPDGKLASVGKKRTRTGCLNCRRKRRKCDEKKPTCEGCISRQEACEWGVKLSFRPENAQSMSEEHPSMRLAAGSVRCSTYQIVDVTLEVIRDYIEEAVPDDIFPRIDPTVSRSVKSVQEAPVTTTGHTVVQAATPATFDTASYATVSMPTPTSASDPMSAPTPVPLFAPGVPTTAVTDPMGLSFLSPQMSSDATSDDGIFLPGSQYLELHAQLRNRIIDTARSTVPSRLGTPDVDDTQLHQRFDETDYDNESRRLAALSPEQEYILWQNYIGEVAGWIDKFDINRHFELVLPVLAKSHSHLKYAILALSARQIERKEQALDYSCSLALYQHAVHLLSAALHRRTTAVLASCVVLAVLEMLSCSPKAWRRHLDGCAALIQALGLSGACGGLEQALFWVFARMDVCGGLISSERTLIPMHKWMLGSDILLDIAMMEAQDTFDMYANSVVYLLGRVIDLLCSAGKWEQRHHRRSDLRDMVDYPTEWSQLFELVEAWYQNRPEEVKALLTIPSDGQDPSRPFPTLLYGNGPATSGNQMYHTAALLMLKYCPAHLHLAKKPRSMLWHARQICAISISNAHHGCWTNSTQPLWIAGQHMSHPSEHKAILEIYERIERETGWATAWRADDLRTFWGEL